MVRKKVDSRIRVMIENGVTEKHRTLIVIVGNKSRDQVVILHHMLSKAAIKARPTVLWCYKKELGFSSHRKKRMKLLQKRIKDGTLNLRDDDPFELFVAATNIRYCYYNETHKILGNTYGMCVLQDFEALTPNLLARTIETVEGGGIIAVLLKSVSSLKQLFTLSMDVHSRYRTQSHTDIVCRFNERLILSLTSCSRCLVIDDQLNILPLSSHALEVVPVTPHGSEDAMTPDEAQLKEIRESLRDTQPTGSLVNICRTLDQAKALLHLIEAISEKSLRHTVAMTAARGRGKSAALGLAIAAAVSFGYSNIFVTSPSPENLKTLFEFITKGFDAMNYEEHVDYDLVESSNPEFGKALIRVNIYRETHRQIVQYIPPSESAVLGQAELLVVDEAAAIPLTLVQNLVGPYLMFLSSTINGYEGTGRSLSLKLIAQLREQSGVKDASGRILTEVQLNHSIRYANNDPVESWMNSLLCLDVSNVACLRSGCPPPNLCNLYYINRDTLFSYHDASEAFLKRIVSIYVSAHYKNSPNDLQMLSDAPAHHLFCLLGPINPESDKLPEVLCLLQVCFEGRIPSQVVTSSFARGQRSSGDLIPWTVSQQFQDADFPSLSGARIVRIATHPDYQSLGYGSKALQLLDQYYSGLVPYLPEEDSSVGTVNDAAIATVDDRDIGLLDEHIEPRSNLPPLLVKLTERRAELLNYLGVSYGLTYNLLRFWRKAGFTPVYLRQTANDLTGEHTCIMLKVLGDMGDDTAWLEAYWKDFKRRLVSLFAFDFSKLSPSFALTLMKSKQFKDSDTSTVDRLELERHLTQYDLKRIRVYSKNMVDYHLILDLIPVISRLYFNNRISLNLSVTQQAILLAIGLQHKSIDAVSKELQLPATQVLGFFNKIFRKIDSAFNEVMENDISKSIAPSRVVRMEPMDQSLEEDLAEGVEDGTEETSMEVLKGADLSQYAIGGTKQDWGDLLKPGSKLTTVSIATRKDGSAAGNVDEILQSLSDKDKGHRHKKDKQFGKRSHKNR